MRTSLSHRCARFLDARDMLRRAFPFAHAQMIPICAGMAAGQDRPWDAGRLYACRDLIQEKTGFLAVFKVYCIPDAVFGDLRFGTVWNRDSVQREKAFVFGHSLQFSDGYVIAFVNAPDSLSVFCQQAIQFWKQ